MLKSAPGPLKLVPLKGSFPRVPLSKPDHLVLHPGAWVSSVRFNLPPQRKQGYPDFDFLKVEILVAKIDAFPLPWAEVKQS